MKVVPDRRLARERIDGTLLELFFFFFLKLFKKTFKILITNFYILEIYRHS